MEWDESLLTGIPCHAGTMLVTSLRRPAMRRLMQPSRLADVARHMSTCQRPPLPQCTAAEFEEDLLTFLEGRGEEELANHLRNKRINWYGASREHPLAQQGLVHTLGPSRVQSFMLDLAWLCIAWLAGRGKFL